MEGGRSKWRGANMCVWVCEGNRRFGERRVCRRWCRCSQRATFETWTSGGIPLFYQIPRLPTHSRGFPLVPTGSFRGGFGVFWLFRLRCMRSVRTDSSSSRSSSSSSSRSSSSSSRVVVRGERDGNESEKNKKETEENRRSTKKEAFFCLRSAARRCAYGSSGVAPSPPPTLASITNVGVGAKKTKKTRTKGEIWGTVGCGI